MKGSGGWNSNYGPPDGKATSELPQRVPEQVFLAFFCVSLPPPPELGLAP